MQIKIDNLYMGESKNIIDKKGKKYISSYIKEKIDSDVFVSTLGLQGDTQSDLKHHGGIDKAICVYSLKNYEFLENNYNIKLPTCAFGENISLSNISDVDVCIGDIYSCEDAIFEVSQPREPCWKISSITGIKSLTSLLVKEAKTGFYLRVLKEGKINKNSSFTLLQRPYENLNIEFINKCFYNAKDNQENIKKIISCEKLAQAYVKGLEKRYINKAKGLTKNQKYI